MASFLSYWMSLLLLALLSTLVFDTARADDSRLPLCTPSNLKLANASLGSFYLLPDGTFRYEMPHCRLRRFTAVQAARCLKGVHLVFMGDSLSRYFYLSLAHLLARGRWTSKFAKLPYFPSRHKSILNENDYKNWALFYHDSNKFLNNGRKATEICDCWRSDKLKWFGEGIHHQQFTCYENRHFRYMPNGDLDDQDNDVRLSYMQWYGFMPIRGHKYASLHPRDSSFYEYMAKLNEDVCPASGNKFWPLSKNCSLNRPDLTRWDVPQFAWPQLCNDYPPMKETSECQKYERDMLGPMKATHLVMNIGWHAGLGNYDGSIGVKFLTKVTEAAEKFFAFPGRSNISRDDPTHTSVPDGWGGIHLPKVTWRTTTSFAPFRGGDEIARQFHIQHGRMRMEYFDIFDTTEEIRKYHQLTLKNDTIGLRQMVKLSKMWPKDKPWNYTHVLPTWIDDAHPQPWYYSEAHNVFLSAICPA